MAFSINHILFPTDFSKNAERALPFAAEMALKANAKLTLFNASQQSIDVAPDFEQAKQKAIEDSSKYFGVLLKKLKTDRYKDLPIATVIQDGATTTALLNKVQDSDVDFIVMGTKGVTGDRNAIFGSVASHIIQKSPVPVLAIPNGSTLNNFNNFVFTSDYKEADLTSLRNAIDIAKLFDASVDVLHVSDQKDLTSEIKFRGFRELVQEHVDYDKISFHHRYDLDFFPAVGEYIVNHPESLLVMVRYEKTFWEKLAERNHSKEMAFYSKVPLLVMLAEQNAKSNTILEQSQAKKS